MTATWEKYGYNKGFGTPFGLQHYTGMAALDMALTERQQRPYKKLENIESLCNISKFQRKYSTNWYNIYSGIRSCCTSFYDGEALMRGEIKAWTYEDLMSRAAGESVFQEPGYTLKPVYYSEYARVCYNALNLLRYVDVSFVLHGWEGRGETFDEAKENSSKYQSDSGGDFFEDIQGANIYYCRRTEYIYIDNFNIPNADVFIYVGNNNKFYPYDGLQQGVNRRRLDSNGHLNFNEDGGLDLPVGEVRRCTISGMYLDISQVFNFFHDVIEEEE